MGRGSLVSHLEHGEGIHHGYAGLCATYYQYAHPTAQPADQTPLDSVPLHSAQFHNNKQPSLSRTHNHTNPPTCPQPTSRSSQERHSVYTPCLMRWPPRYAASDSGRERAGVILMSHFFLQCCITYLVLSVELTLQQWPLYGRQWRGWAVVNVVLPAMLLLPPPPIKRLVRNRRGDVVRSRRF